jgi:hypothetical protein
VASLALLLHVGSPQSNEGDERVEAKIDFLVEQTHAGEQRKKELDRVYFRQWLDCDAISRSILASNVAAWRRWLMAFF